MTIQRRVLVALAIVFGVFVSAYVYLHSAWRAYAANGLSMSNECDGDAAVAQQNQPNPNKMLFISCGGFIE